MNAVLTAPDALVLSAVVTAVAGAGFWQARRVNKQMHPNAGKTFRDVVDRIEFKLDTEVIPRLDQGAIVMAKHADRIAVVEDRNAIVELANRVGTLETSIKKRTLAK